MEERMKKFLIIFTSFIFLNLVSANTLEFTDIQIDANTSGTLELLLDNPTDVIGGFQFQVIDMPDHGFFTIIEGTDRTNGFQIEFNEQPDGSIIIVGFDLNLQGVQPGSGPILSLTYQSLKARAV